MAKIYIEPAGVVELLPNAVGADHDLGLAEELSVVVPKGGTNLIRNPLTVPYGDLAQLAVSTPNGTGPVWVTGASPFGPYAHQWDPAAGQTGFQMVDESAPVPGGQFTACFAIRGPCGARWNLRVLQNGAGSSIEPMVIEGTGCWQRVCARGFSQGNGGAAQYMTVFLEAVNGFAPQEPFYTSNYQIVSGDSSDQTFIAGYGFDWPGVQDFGGANGAIYRWNGAAHSSSSTRHRWSRSGGEVVRFSDLDAVVVASDGLRMSSVQNTRQPYAKIDGSYALSQYYSDSTIRLRLKFFGDRKEIAESISCMEQMFKRYVARCPEPIQLLYRCRDECGQPCGEELKLICWYEGGLEGSIADISQEEQTVSLVTTRPFWEGDRVTWEGPLLAGGTNTGPGVSAASVIENAYCVGFGKKTAITTYPQIVIQGAAATILRVENVDTGALLEFNTPGLAVAADQVLVINTDPSNSSVQVYGPGTLIANEAGSLAGPGLSSFHLEPGVNNLRFTFTNVTNPAFVANQPPTGVVPPVLTISWPTRYISFSEACICNEWGQCDPNDVLAGFTLLDEPAANSIVAPPNAP